MKYPTPKIGEVSPSGSPAPGLGSGTNAILAVAPVLMAWETKDKGPYSFEITLPAFWITRYQGPRRGGYTFQPIQHPEFPHLGIHPLKKGLPKVQRDRAIKCTWPKNPTTGPSPILRMRAPGEGLFFSFVEEHWLSKRSVSDYRIPVKVLGLLYPDDVLILVRNESISGGTYLMPESAVEGFRQGGTQCVSPGENPS